jgi:hypothetical protein
MAHQAPFTALGLAALVAAAALTTPARGVVPQHPTVAAPDSTRGTADPAHNTATSQKFDTACRYGKRTTAAQKACDKAAIVDFDRVRKGEGIGPITLPKDFVALSVPVQLLVLSDLERVDRGLVPVQALSPQLDTLAEQGAQRRTDPAFENPFEGNAGGSNWAQVGPSPLLADFDWMYDDGYGSANGDCTSPSASGCWGHRHDILGTSANNFYSEPLLMGAAAAHHDESQTEEFVSGDHKDTTRSPTWATLAKAIPLGVSKHAVRLTSNSAQTVKVRVWASGVAMKVTAAITSGGSAWTVSPTRLSLAAGRQAALSLAYDPSGSGGAATSGTLTLTTHNGTQHIPLKP